ncbi:glyoxalase [Microbacterium protaetiae]|uniref:Glyoxalase n=1 Tax=Microbacterium protaetiae TaxID=2509458 RepID=A0A4V0YD40_9MICO|nr:VOC family protein [Microbacterium protaetiae]QAY59381.1 glyoxalase [Microbacterium protaetiae]
MATHLFVSLPTSDLERSTAFYTALGTTINPTFTDENATCFMWDENIFFMLLKREFMATMTAKPLADPAQTVQVSHSFSRPSREDVDRIVEAGLAAGGSEPQPAQDFGFMYMRDLDDPDGNSLGFLYSVPDESVPEDDLADQVQGTA